MDKVWRKGLRMVSTLGLAISFLCYSSIDVIARNEVTMLVCGDSKMESIEAFNTLYRDLMGGEGFDMGTDHPDTYCTRGTMDMNEVSADLSANLNMYHVDDVYMPPKLLFRADLLVLIYAGKETEGLGNLPLLQEKLKSRKHRVKLPDMILLRLDEVLPSPSYDEEHGVRGCALKLIKACGNLWPRDPIKEKDGRLNADGCID